MTHTIDQFGFEACEEIPVKENDWITLINAFTQGPATIIKREFENSRKASNAGSAIRKAAKKIGAQVTVTNDGGTLYISKA